MSEVFLLEVVYTEDNLHAWREELSAFLLFKHFFIPTFIKSCCLQCSLDVVDRFSRHTTNILNVLRDIRNRRGTRILPQQSQSRLLLVENSLRSSVTFGLS